MKNESLSDVFYEYSDQWGESGYKIVGENVVSFYEDRKEQQGGEGSPINFKEFINTPLMNEEIITWVKAHFKL